MRILLLKITTFLIVCTYVFTNIGFSVIEHYCAGELEEIAVFKGDINCCGDEEDLTTNDGCCKNKTTHIAFHKDFTLKILIKYSEKDFQKNVPKKITQNNTSHFLKTSTHYVILPKVPPPKLLQHCLIQFSVIRI